jgi:hypothetical protein
LLRSGSERVVESARDHVADLRSLEKFEYMDPKGKDQGINGLSSIELSLSQATKLNHSLNETSYEIKVPPEPNNTLLNKIPS